MRAIGLKTSRYHADRVRGENRPFADEENGVHYYDNLAVGRAPRMASVLIEAGVVVNPTDERRVTAPSMRRAIAAAIARGASECLK
jgi:N-acetylmuramoyl-L-alanine amidase